MRDTQDGTPEVSAAEVEAAARVLYNASWDGEWHTQWDGSCAEQVQDDWKRRARAAIEAFLALRRDTQDGTEREGLDTHPGFSEQSLRQAIVNTWGPAGAHIDVFDHLLAALGRAEAERDRMRDAILDIDAHATALGEDAEGFVKGGYAVSVGAMHRALGVVGHTAHKRGEHAVWIELEHGQACEGCIELKAIALEAVGATYRKTTGTSAAERDRYTYPGWMYCAPCDALVRVGEPHTHREVAPAPPKSEASEGGE